MTRITFPNTGMEATLDEKIVYHGVEVVDGVEEAARRLEEFYQVPLDVRQSKVDLSPSENVVPTCGMFSVMKERGEYPFHAYILLERRVNNPHARTFLLGHEEFHAVNFIDESAYPVSYLKDNLSRYPFTNDVANLIFSNPAVGLRFENDPKVMIEILADTAGIMAVERVHGYSREAERLCFTMLSSSPECYGPISAALFRDLAR